MHSSVDIEGVDFRPFFDMVVGILFVLLILIGAVLFFQQSAEDESAAREAELNARVVDAQIARFLAMMANDLRQHGLETRVDLPNRSVSLPLGSLANIGPGGLPDVSAQGVEDLGRTLANDLQCLIPAMQHPGFCTPYDRVRLSLASVRVQTGNLTDGAALPHDQFARLLTSEFSTTLFRTAPSLLSLANEAGYAAVDTVGRLSMASPEAGRSIGGEVEIHLDFTPP